MRHQSQCMRGCGHATTLRRALCVLFVHSCLVANVYGIGEPDTGGGGGDGDGGGFKTTTTPTEKITSAVTTTTSTTDGACGAKAGDTPLTQDKVKSGKFEAKLITCIPAEEFESYTGDLSLKGMDSLAVIEEKAFYKFKGKLTFEGTLDSLLKIGNSAFGWVSDKSKVTIKKAPVLEEIGRSAFFLFKGELDINCEDCNNLAVVGRGAFDSQYAASSVSLSHNDCSSVSNDDAWGFYASVLCSQPFTITAKPNRIEPDGGDAECVDPNNPVYIDTAFQVGRLEIDAKKSTVSAGHVDNITFSLGSGAPETVFVQPVTGVVAGTFTGAATYTFDILAVDASGETAVLESLEMRAVERDDFVLTTTGKRTMTGKKYTDPNDADTDFFVGSPYTIAPHAVSSATTVSDGVIADITYKLSDGAPFLVDAATGVISGSFDKVGVYVFELIAIDKAGEEAVLEEHRINAVEQQVAEKFVYGTIAGERTQTTDQFTDPTDTSLTFYVGESYRIAPLEVDQKGTTVSEGTLNDIQFTLSPDAPTSFFVSASSGVIFGQFETAGPYKFSLVARDDGGQTYVVEIFEFVVEERRTFELKLKTQRTQTSDQSFVNPDATDEYFAEESYRIAPLAIDTDATTVSAGDVDDISYTLSKDAPDSFLVSASTGVVFGQFHADFLGQQSSRSIKFSLIAVDKGGKTAVVEELEFKVTKRATLKVVTVDGKRKFNGTEYTDPKFSSSSFGGSDQLYVGTPYRFSPEIIDAEKTVVSKGTVDDITYALSADAPDSFLINSGSGVVFGIFPKRGNYVFDLIAIDKGLQQQSVETFAFQLNDPNPFEFEIYKVRACNKGTTNPSCRELGFTDPKTEWGNGPVVGTTYSIAPFKTNTLRTKVSAGEVEDITYKLSDGTPDTFLVSSSSGRVVCTFPSSGQYVFSLIAVDAGGKEAVVEEFDVTAQEAVTFQVITIPGMRLCGNATGDGCGDNYRDPTNNEPYYVGDRVTFSPLVIDPTKTKIGSGTIEDIRYSLSKDAPDSFFVQASSGIISGSFEEGDELGGDKIFELLAVDKQGAVSTVERFVCNVENVQFKVDEQSKIVRTLPADVASGTVFTNPKRNVIYLVGVTYKFAPLNLSADGAVSGQKGEVTFSVQDAPSGFLISSADGYMQGVPVISDVESTFVVNVFATDERNVNIKVETFTMVIKVRDTDVPTYGPNERDCENSGTRIDSTEFDEEFTCACPSDIDGQSLFEGDNCEEFSARQSQQAADKKKTTTIAIALGVLLAVAICSVAFFRWRAYKIKMKPIDFIARFDEMLATGEIETPYSEDNGLEDGNQNPYAKERRSSQTGVMRQNEGVPREIKRKFLNMLDTIGKGQFGEVYKAMLDESSKGGPPSFMVAAKTVLDSKASPEATRDLESEALVMARVAGHPNLVSLIGVVTRGDPLVLIISYCEHGSLLSLLKSRAAEHDPLEYELKLRLGLDTARGMKHLHEKSFVHRDLASRNVLVASGLIAKVADFGLARGTAVKSEAGTEKPIGDDYFRCASGVFPIRWTAPEAMETLKFTMGSDMWSFGIVIVEIMQNGATPYPGIDNAAVMQKVMGGWRHPQPTECSTAVYETLLDCWNAEVSERPSFDGLIAVLQFEWYKVAEMDQNGIVQKKSRHSSVRKRRTAKSSGDAADAAVTYEYSEGGATPATTNNYEYQETELGGGSGRGKNTYEYQGTSDGTGGGSGIEDQAAGYQEFTAAEAAALKKAKEQGDVSSVANTSGGNKDAFNDSYHFAVNGGGGKQKRIPIKGAEPVYNLAGSSELVLGANDFTSTADAEVEQPLYNLAGSNKGMAFPVKPRRGSSTNDAVDIDVDVDVDANQAPTTLLQTPSLGMHSMGGSSTLVAEEVFHGFSDAGLLGIEL